jgi:glutathione S-transferase
MITVHHLEDSRSQRVLWLMEELQLAYEVKRYDRDPKTRLAPAELLKVHPLGKSPVIDDDGRVVAETGAIIDYVVGRYGAGRLIPADGTDARLAYVYWLHFAEGSAMPPLVMKLIFTTMVQRSPKLLKGVVKAVTAPVLAGFVEPNIARQLAFIEGHLATSPWFAGPEFTAADIMMSFPLEAAAQRADLSALPKVKAFLDAIHARPAYVRALERGGPYAFA